MTQASGTRKNASGTSSHWRCGMRSSLVRRQALRQNPTRQRVTVGDDVSVSRLVIVPHKAADLTRRITGNHRVARELAPDDGAGTDHAVVSELSSAQDDGVGADEHVI